MKILNLVGLAAVILGTLGFVAAIIVPNSLAAKAQLVQRMKPYDPDTAALVGEIGTPIGSPQQMVITDEKAFLPGRGETGARLVNDDYLKAHGEYPLQVKTIHYAAGLVRMGTGAASLIGLAVFLWTRKRLRPNPHPDQLESYHVSPVFTGKGTNS